MGCVYYLYEQHIIYCGGDIHAALILGQIILRLKRELNSRDLKNNYKLYINIAYEDLLFSIPFFSITTIRRKIKILETLKLIKSEYILGDYSKRYSVSDYIFYRYVINSPEIIPI